MTAAATIRQSDLERIFNAARKTGVRIVVKVGTAEIHTIPDDHPQDAGPIPSGLNTRMLFPPDGKEQLE